MNNQEDAVIETPEHKIPGGAMPEPSQHHRDHQVSVGLRHTFTVATQRDVEIVAEPIRKADMPARPKLSWIPRKVWKVEVENQFKSDQLGNAARDISVSRKIAVDLDCEGIDT